MRRKPTHSKESSLTGRERLKKVKMTMIESLPISIFSYSNQSSHLNNLYLISITLNKEEEESKKMTPHGLAGAAIPITKALHVYQT